MIIITMNNNYELKYKGNINLEIDENFMLWIKGDYNLDGWNTSILDGIFVEDIQSIRGENDRQTPKHQR